ncbi:MAG TPA: hypothetical protein VIK52_01420 [Opitutaceae bacterium]
MSEAQYPKLDPPGAGLGKMEGWLTRYIVFPMFCRTTSFEDATVIFENEGRRIEDLCGLFTPEQFTQRVLVPPLPGIEDSSRHWSAAMLVEHLVIVGSSVSKVLVFLSRGQTPPFAMDIAGVKPTGSHGIGVMLDFRRLLAEYPALVRNDLPRPPDAPRFAHPWFGDLDIHHWHCLAAMHLRVHRRQLFLIRKGLGSGPPSAKTRSVFGEPVPDSPPALSG